MKTSRYTEEQIAFALKQAELGTPVEEVCRKMGISVATFYNWRKKFGGLAPSEVRRLKQVEEENAKLKRLVADLSLDKAMLQDVLSRMLIDLGKAALERGLPINAKGLWEGGDIIFFGHELLSALKSSQFKLDGIGKINNIEIPDHLHKKP